MMRLLSEEMLQNKAFSVIDSSNLKSLPGLALVSIPPLSPSLSSHFISLYF